MGTCCDVFESIESSFHPYNITAIVPGAYAVEAKCALDSLNVAK